MKVFYYILNFNGFFFTDSDSNSVNFSSNEIFAATFTTKKDAEKAKAAAIAAGMDSAKFKIMKRAFDL